MRAQKRTRGFISKTFVRLTHRQQRFDYFRANYNEIFGTTSINGKSYHLKVVGLVPVACKWAERYEKEGEDDVSAPALQFRRLSTFSFIH